jgi:NADH:ubiquinone oxidoreductase subunit 2 (subunit N)
MKGIAFFSISEMIAMLGVFMLLLNIKKNRNKKLEFIDDFNGLSGWNPSLAISISFIFLSLFGFAPFIGLWSQYHVCLSLIRNGDIAETIIYVLSIAINMFCLAKILCAIWLEKPEDGIYFVISEHASLKSIHFISLMTITAIFIANKVVSLMKVEM